MPASSWQLATANERDSAAAGNEQFRRTSMMSKPSQRRSSSWKSFIRRAVDPSSSAAESVPTGARKAWGSFSSPPPSGSTFRSRPEGVDSVIRIQSVRRPNTPCTSEAGGGGGGTDDTTQGWDEPCFRESSSSYPLRLVSFILPGSLTGRSPSISAQPFAPRSGQSDRRSMDLVCAGSGLSPPRQRSILKKRSLLMAHQDGSPAFTSLMEAPCNPAAVSAASSASLADPGGNSSTWGQVGGDVIESLKRAHTQHQTGVTKSCLASFRRQQPRTSSGSVRRISFALEVSYTPAPPRDEHPPPEANKDADTAAAAVTRRGMYDYESPEGRGGGGDAGVQRAPEGGDAMTRLATAVAQPPLPYQHQQQQPKEQQQQHQQQHQQQMHHHQQQAEAVRIDGGNDCDGGGGGVGGGGATVSRPRGWRAVWRQFVAAMTKPGSSGARNEAARPDSGAKRSEAKATGAPVTPLVRLCPSPPPPPPTPAAASPFGTLQGNDGHESMPSTTFMRRWPVDSHILNRKRVKQRKGRRAAEGSGKAPPAILRPAAEAIPPPPTPAPAPAPSPAPAPTPASANVGDAAVVSQPSGTAGGAVDGDEHSKPAAAASFAARGTVSDRPAPRRAATLGAPAFAAAVVTQHPEATSPGGRNGGLLAFLGLRSGSLGGRRGRMLSDGGGGCGGVGGGVASGVAGSLGAVGEALFVQLEMRTLRTPGSSRLGSGDAARRGAPSA